MRLARLFYIIVLVFCALEIARLWGIMPAEMAAHFNIHGSPDRFVSKAEFFSFQIQTMLTVVLVSLPLQLLFLVLPPGMVNLPNREYWLAPERRVETMGRISDFGFTMFGVIFIAVQSAFELAAYANLHTPIVFDARRMGVVMLSSGAVIVWILVRLVFSFRQTPAGD